MHFDGTIYRPPYEADSQLLQVTSGCSHNKCRFCTMYRNSPFKVSPMEEVEADIAEIKAKRLSPFFKRVFLEGGDAFSLSGDKLIAIAEKLNEALPSLEVISSYANINNIKTKSDEELVRLAQLKVGDLNIGLESGDDWALEYMNKGYDAAAAIEQLERLKKAGIRYSINIIYGLSGRERTREAALKTAEIISKADPFLLFVGTVHYTEDCPLYTDIKSGEFSELTVREYLEEEKLFLQNLNVTDCIYFSTHPANILLKKGHLPEDKQALLEFIDEKSKEIPEEWMDAIPQRGGEEGSVLIDV